MPSSSRSDSTPTIHMSTNLLSSPPTHTDAFFHDPVLQYIDQFMMQDEHLDDQKCMIQECVLHHATMKELSDILCTGESSSSYEQYESTLQGGLEQVVITAKNSDKPEQAVALPVPSFPGVTAVPEPNSVVWSSINNDGYESYSQSNDDTRWTNSFPHFINGHPSIQNVATAYVFQGHEALSSSPARRRWSSERSAESRCRSLSHPIPPSSTSSDTWDKQPVLTSRFHNYARDVQNGVPEVSQHRSQAETTSTVVWNVFSTSQRHLYGVEAAISQAYSAANSHPRYEPTELLAVSVARHWPRRMQSIMPARTLDSEQSQCSYVKNANLNAETDAEPLLHGLDSVKESLKYIKPPASRPYNGKNTGRLATNTDLTSLLLSCAQAVGMDNVKRAHEILKEIRRDASPHGNDVQRLAHYFAEGLIARLTGTGGQLYAAFTANAPSAAKMLEAHRLIVSVCPFLKPSDYVSGTAILKAAKQASRLHIVDYGIAYGLQWPGLISALAEREGGPPHLRITGIDFPEPGENPSGRLEMTGHYLAEYAKTYNVPFEFRPIATEWENVNASMLHLREDEVLVVNSVYRLRHVFDETVLLQSNCRQAVLKNIYDMKPKIFVQGVYNANHSSPFFMSRFKEALTLYASIFDMLDTLMSSNSQVRLMIEREVVGREILNIVACEGTERVERPETYKQWQNRTQKAGFVQMPLDEKTMSDIATIIKHKYNKHFSIDQDGCWMLLGWKGKVLNCLSVWKPGHHECH